LDVLLSISTFVVATVGMWAIVAGKIQRDQQWEYEWRNALLALSVECQINLALLGEASGYGQAAVLREAALQRALPFLSHLPSELSREAVNVGMGIALHGRHLLLAAEDARNRAHPSGLDESYRQSKRDGAFLQQVADLKASLQSVADGVHTHAGPRQPVSRTMLR
jgi:hypothetical protein